MRCSVASSRFLILSFFVQNSLGLNYFPAATAVPFVVDASVMVVIVAIVANLLMDML